MKFTPESLIEIYLNGSFTEEAQTEFDKLMRKDPVFAERVTRAVAERVGPAPASLEQIGTNLDSKIDGLWQNHKPSPYHHLLKKSVQVAVLLAATGGLYGGFKHYWTNHHAANGEEGVVSPVSDTSAIHEGNVVSGGSSGTQTSSSTSSAVNEKTALKKSEKNHSQGQTASVGLSGLPAAVGSNLSTPPPLKTSENSSAQANPALSANQGVGGQGTGSSSTIKNQPSMANAPQAEEGDALRVSIETEKKQKVVVTVLDSNGLLVRHLYQGRWNAGVHLVDWDGKDEIGNPVLPGNYTVVMSADGKSQTGTVTVLPNR